MKLVFRVQVSGPNVYFTLERLSSWAVVPRVGDLIGFEKNREGGLYRVAEVVHEFGIKQLVVDLECCVYPEDAEARYWAGYFREHRFLITDGERYWKCPSGSQESGVPEQE